MLYLRGIDFVSHSFWKESVRAEGTGVRIIPGSAVECYYEHLDSIVGRILDAAADGDFVLLMSDHGFQRAYPQEKPDISGSHSKLGIFWLKGPEVRAHRDDDVINGLDVTPTLLQIFGLPPSKEMPGKPLLWPDRPMKRIGSYAKELRDEKPTPLPEDERRLLKQVGYLR